MSLPPFSACVVPERTASVARAALATVLQFIEGLSDRGAADAVRGRIDWKYLFQPAASSHFWRI